MTYLSCHDAPATTDYATVYIAWELSKADWKLGVLLPGARQMSRFTVKGGDLAAVSARLAAARAKAARSGLPVRILSCYEAGFEGHWLHRWLENQGVVSHEVDPSSIEVNRRARRAKTDRIDLARIMRAFLAYLRGEPLACSIVHVPTSEEEDDKRPSRERERLLKERTAHTNRIKALLHAQGIRDAKPLARDFLRGLKDLRTGDGRPLPLRLAEEIAREHERLVVVDRQIAAIEAQSKAECQKAAPGSSTAKIVQLAQLKGLGITDGRVLVKEVFYRRFDNRRQVGACVGLTGTPYKLFERPKLNSRIQPKYLIMAGAFIAAVSMHQLSDVYGDLGSSFFARSRMVLGVGLPLIFIPILAASYDGIPPNRIDMASALINAARNTGGSIGISLANNMVWDREQFHQARLAENAIPSSIQYQLTLHQATQYFLPQGSSPAHAAGQAIAWIGQEITLQAWPIRMFSGP
jgi:transposase